jgi:RHS repeat-associated protein
LNLTSKTGLLTGSWTYTNNRLNGTTISAGGNQTSFSGKTLAYNEENKIKTVGGTVTYSYDGKGNRTKIVDSIASVTRLFIYDEAGTLLSELSTFPYIAGAYVTKEYVNGPTGTLATINYDERAQALSASNDIDHVHLVWREMPGCRISTVNIYRATVSGGPYTLIAPGCCTDDFTYNDFNVINGTRYYYQIRPVYSDTGFVGYPSAELAHTFSTTAVNNDGPVNSYASAPVYYDINDHLGTPRITTDEDGVTVGSFEYYPFGETKVATGCRESDQRFTGKPTDSESGLQHYGARFMANSLARFTSVDPSHQSASSEDPQSWNRYAYSNGDPINFIDPTGLVVINNTSHDVRVKLETGDNNYVTLKPGETSDAADGVIVGGKILKINNDVDIVIGNAKEKIKDSACPGHTHYVEYESYGDQLWDAFQNIIKEATDKEKSGIYDYEDFIKNHPDWVDPERK